MSECDDVSPSVLHNGWIMIELEPHAKRLVFIDATSGWQAAGPRTIAGRLNEVEHGTRSLHEVLTSGTGDSDVER